jgi:polyisoprenoid-binding protein YceI
MHRRFGFFHARIKGMESGDASPHSKEPVAGATWYSRMPANYCVNQVHLELSMRSFILVAICLVFMGCLSETQQASKPPADVAIPITSPSTEASTPATPPANESTESTPSGTKATDAPAPAGDSSNSSAGGAAAADSALNSVAIESGVATIGPKNTRIQFVGTHVGPKPDPRTGVFTDFTGKVEVDPETKTIKSVSVDIKTESLETPLPKLTNHLRSQDFFDAKELPNAKFQSTTITPGEGEGNYVIAGNLTLLKVTKEVRIPSKVTISDKGISSTGEFTIDRTEFGMSGLQKNVNKEVVITVTIGQPTEKK